MTTTLAVFDYIKKYYIVTDGPIKGPDELDFEMSSRWVREAYLSLLDGQLDLLSLPNSLPTFIASYTPSELVMLLVDDDNTVYHFEWNERVVVFVRKESLEV